MNDDHGLDPGVGSENSKTWSLPRYILKIDPGLTGPKGDGNPV